MSRFPSGVARCPLKIAYLQRGTGNRKREASKSGLAKELRGFRRGRSTRFSSCCIRRGPRSSFLCCGRIPCIRPRGIQKQSTGAGSTIPCPLGVAWSSQVPGGCLWSRWRRTDRNASRVPIPRLLTPSCILPERRQGRIPLPA
jgi:hypothetical protein